MMSFFIPSPCLAAEKQGSGLTFSSENEIFNPENEHFKREWFFRAWGNVFFFFFSRVRARMIFSISGPSWTGKPNFLAGYPGIFAGILVACLARGDGEAKTDLNR